MRHTKKFAVATELAIQHGSLEVEAVKDSPTRVVDTESSAIVINDKKETSLGIKCHAADIFTRFKRQCLRGVLHQIKGRDTISNGGEKDIIMRSGGGSSRGSSECSGRVG